MLIEKNYIEEWNSQLKEGYTYPDLNNLWAREVPEIVPLLREQGYEYFYISDKNTSLIEILRAFYELGCTLVKPMQIDNPSFTPMIKPNGEKFIIKKDVLLMSLN